jgi:hypothetical protein
MMLRSRTSGRGDDQVDASPQQSVSSCGCVSQKILIMPDYQYKIGQKVFIRGAARLGTPRGAYQILERLPAQNDQLHYFSHKLGAVQL